MVLRFITRELPIVSQKSNIARMRVTEGRLVRTLCLHYSASMIRRFLTNSERSVNYPWLEKFGVYRLLDSWFTEMSTRAAFLLANRPVTMRRSVQSIIQNLESKMKMVEWDIPIRKFRDAGIIL